MDHLYEGLILENRYKLIEQLGKGGFAVVWEVADLEANGDRKAIKIFTKHSFKEMMRFRDEFWILDDLKDLKCDRIVTVESNSLYPKQKPCPDDFVIPLHFFVMEKCKGITLEKLTKKSSKIKPKPTDIGLVEKFKDFVFPKFQAFYQFLFYRYPPLRSPISYLQIADWIEQLAEAIQYLHSQQIMHRDIKPRNIIITNDDNLKLIDFGAAQKIDSEYDPEYLYKFDQKSVNSAYTTGYVSPEQEMGQARLHSDFYSFGYTVLFALTGKHPSDLEPNCRSQFPPELNSFINKATHEDPLKRHPDANNLLKEAKQVTRSLHSQYGRWAVAKQMAVVIGIAVIATFGTLAMRLTGLLQPLELAAYDQMLRMRPTLPPDPHLLIVAIKPEDYEWMGGRDISNTILTKTIQRLLPYQPRVIGIGVARDQPDREGMEELAQLLQKYTNIFGSCEHSFGKTKSSFSFMPTPAAPLGFGTTSEDIHRQILAYRKPPRDKCAAKASFNLLVAHHYLNTEYNHPIGSLDHTYQLGVATFPSLELGQGAYQYSGIDRLDNSFQILVDYRSQPIAETISLTQLMTTDIAPQKIHDRIVLIGRFDVNADSPHQTPYGGMFSVELRAQMISQLVNTAEGKRPVLKPASFEVDLLCIVLVASLSSFVGWRVTSWRGQGIFLLSLFIGLFSGCLLMLAIAGLWIGFVPTAIVAIVANSGIFLYTRYNYKLNKLTGKA